MKLLQACLILVVVCIVGACVRDENSPVRGQSDTVCDQGCAVTFSELVPKREQYDGKEIVVSGFLALSNGMLALQPSEQAYLSAVGDMEAITFNIPATAQEKIIRDHLNRYVSVRGIFNVGSENRAVGMGHFSRVLAVNPKIVRVKPEGVDEWKVRLEDFD